MSSPPDDRPQVAWKAIEEDAQVYSSEGHPVARVTRVVGDTTADVFTGLAIRLGTFGGERFVAAERVQAIWPDRVDLALTHAEIEALPKHEDAPSTRWRPRGALLSRLFSRR